MESREFLEAALERCAEDECGACPMNEGGGKVCRAFEGEAVLVPTELIRRTVNLLRRGADVVKCQHCVHCYSTAPEDPRPPWTGGDGAFYCEVWDTEFYTPRYNARTYFCADGKRREGKG